MEKNEQKKNHDTEKETVSFGFPISDLFIPRASEKDWKPQEKHWKPTQKLSLPHPAS